MRFETAKKPGAFAQALLHTHLHFFQCTRMVILPNVCTICTHFVKALCPLSVICTEHAMVRK